MEQPYSTLNNIKKQFYRILLKNIFKWDLSSFK